MTGAREYAGVGAALLAFYLKAKTSRLREHYMSAYGAIPFSRFDPYLLLIDGEAAGNLFGQYLEEG